jgi:hypothetical protein
VRFFDFRILDEQAMHKRLFVKSLITALPILLLCPIALAQDQSNTPAALSQQPHLSEVMDWIDKNGLPQARVGVRTASQPAREELSGVIQQDAYPALSLFYAEGFRVVQGDACGVILKNENTRLLAHSKLVAAPSSDQRYTAELFIPLDRLSVKKGKGPYRQTSNSDKGLGNWRTEFKSNRSNEDVVLTLFAPGQTEKLRVWKAETLTFTFDDKQTSEKFTTAFRQAIKICQPVKYLMRKNARL